MVVRLDEEYGAIFRRDSTQFSVTIFLTSSIHATALFDFPLFVGFGVIDPLHRKC